MRKGSVVAAETVVEMKRLVASGVSKVETARRLGLSRETVMRHMNPGGLERHRQNGAKSRERWAKKCACGQPFFRGESCRDCYVRGGKRIPLDRLQPLVAGELRGMGVCDGGLGRSTMQALAERCGVHWFTIDKVARGIRPKQSRTVEFDTADKILGGLGLTYLWHLPPSKGGFADLYEDDYEEEAA